MMTLSGFTTDIMLPAFDAMVVDLNTSLDLVQGTVAAFALFFGIAQFSTDRRLTNTAVGRSS